MSEQTSKNLKIIGTEKYVNLETGTIQEMQVVEMEHRDANFQKLWISTILKAVDELSSKRMKVVFWLVNESVKHKNVIPMTTNEIAKTLKISRTTLSDTLRILAKHDIIRRERGRIWMNPKVVFKGAPGSRMGVLMRYKNVSKYEEKEKKVDQLTLLNKRLNCLKKEMEAVRKEMAEFRSKSSLDEDAEIVILEAAGE